MNISPDIHAAIESAESITVLTGAGVSTASGIPDFKSTDETWPHPVPREVAISLSFFRKDPDAFWDIFRQTFHSKLDAQPNAVHRWIAGLEQGRDWSTVATQNVDGLHRAAGSREVIEVHGNIFSTLCIAPRCRRLYDEPFATGTGAPPCPECGSPLKPNVVLFEEDIKNPFAAMSAARRAEVLLVMGTSLRVAPFNGIANRARWSNRSQVQIYVGHEEPPAGRPFDHVLIGDLTDFVENVQPTGQMCR